MTKKQYNQLVKDVQELEKLLHAVQGASHRAGIQGERYTVQAAFNLAEGARKRLKCAEEMEGSSQLVTAVKELQV